MQPRLGGSVYGRGVGSSRNGHFPRDRAPAEGCTETCQRRERRRMMKRKFLSTQSRDSTSDRFGAARFAVLAALRWRSLAKAAEQGLNDARAALGDPQVQAETRALLADLTSASRRAREVGLSRAFDDKLLSSRLSRASRHAANALDAARGRRRRRRSAALRALAVTGAAGLTAASAYAGWKIQSRGRHPA